MIYALNNSNPSQIGNGLVFYTDLSYQLRFRERSFVSNIGVLKYPSNRLPVFQALLPKTLVAANLFVVLNGQDQLFANLNINNFDEVCVNVNGDGTRSYVFKDDTPVKFTLPCGLYYLQIVTAGGTFYSELFKSGEICEALPFLDAVIDSLPSGGFQDIEFFFGINGITGTGEQVVITENIGGAPVATLTTSPTVLSLQVGVSYRCVYTITTSCGVFTQIYIIETNGTTVTNTILYN